MDLRVDHGERVLLLGASGSGKSTFLRAIAGLLSEGGEAEGTLLVDGGDPAAARADTGLLFQDPETQLVMARAGDELAFPLENRCVPADALWPRVDEALAQSGLGIGRDHPTEALSGGERQRLALAAVLIARPRLLLLDEPTANLDAAAASAFGEALAGVASEGRTLVLVEHRVDAVLPFITRVIAISGERGVIADGPPATVFTRDRPLLEAEGVWLPGTAVTPRRGAAGAPLLVARAVGYRYPGADRDAVAGLTLALLAGEATALAGANGSGKSTLALMLGGLLRPGRGSVDISDALAHRGANVLWRMPARALVSRAGSVFQDPTHQFVRRRVDDELAVGPRRAGLPAGVTRRRVAELLERLRLGALAAANPFTLSGGEQRRLSVATALATRPRILVLDEPTFGLDRRGHAELTDLLHEYRAGGGALCFATHDASLIAALADRVHVMAR
ncbi:MAG TPA: ABC transporter ATP-binding protein [Candidatus Limnocylindria bacterium]|nr:ABC transporter ATP-binding protein [Candidatus Limnocylindria bacterium]